MWNMKMIRKSIYELTPMSLFFVFTFLSTYYCCYTLTVLKLFVKLRNLYFLVVCVLTLETFENHWFLRLWLITWTSLRVYLFNLCHSLQKGFRCIFLFEFGWIKGRQGLKDKVIFGFDLYFFLAFLHFSLSLF